MSKSLKYSLYLEFLSKMPGRLEYFLQHLERRERQKNLDIFFTYQTYLKLVTSHYHFFFYAYGPGRNGHVIAATITSEVYCGSCGSVVGEGRYVARGEGTPFTCRSPSIGNVLRLRIYIRVQLDFQPSYRKAKEIIYGVIFDIGISDI